MIVDRLYLVYYEGRTSVVDRSWGHEQTLACSCIDAVRRRPWPGRVRFVRIGFRQEPHAGRLLDPAGGLRKADPRLPGDASGQGRELQAVLRAFGRTEPRGLQRPARRRGQLLARPRRRTPGQGGTRACE